MKLVSVFVLLLILPLAMYAQKVTSLQKKIDILYNEALNLSQQGNSLKSIQKLNEILKIDSTYHPAFFALADLNHEAGKPDDELLYLKKGLAYSSDSYPAGFKFLAEALYKKGEYAEALISIERYSSLRKSLNPVEQLLLACCRFSVDAVCHPVPFNTVNPGDSINTEAEEYWPSLNAESDELVFTRLETKDRNGKKIPKPQEDFYQSIFDSTGWHKARPLGLPVNTEENEGAQTLSADGRILIFTGCGRKDGLGSCDLYISLNKNGTWTVPVNMGEPVNSGAWESQPSLSANGQALFFVSSRSGGKGKMDIWKADKIAVSPEGLPLFGNVTNGSEINTAGNDLSPSLHADGKTLYLASDGRPGLGGTDLYLTRLKNGKWIEPVNLGYPINTKSNEEGLIVEISGVMAWFTSNRNPGHGRDLLYFNLSDSLRPEAVSYLRGLVVDAITGLKLQADIVLSNLKTKNIVRSISSVENDGDFLVCLPSGNNYGLNITRPGYLFASENVSLINGYSMKSPRVVTIRLQPVAAGVYTTLKNIFFETNSWQLLEESQTQLDEMAQFMKLNPGVVMEVIGHTDRVGTAAYNLDLSNKRAEAVAIELKKRNIESYRIKSKGVGFTVPVGDNDTEEGRSSNRRTEFMVKEVNKE